MDAKIVHVALTGLENILKLGQAEAQISREPNQYALDIESCSGQLFSKFLSIFIAVRTNKDYKLII